MAKCPHCGAPYDAAPGVPHPCPDCGEMIVPDAPLVRIRTYEPSVHPTAAPLRRPSAHAAGLTFSPCGDGWAVTGCTGRDAHVEIPAMHLDKPVVAVGVRAFRGSAIHSVSLPPTVQVLEKEAFALCLSLTAVTGGEGLLRIGERCFHNCILLEHVWPDSAPEAHITAFAGCYRLALPNENVHYRRERP